MIWSPFAFLCSKQRSKEVSELVLAGEKTQNAQTTEFSKILLSTNFANMLDSLSDLGNLVPRLETVPESHVIPNPPWACGDNEKISPCFPPLPAKLSGGIPCCFSPGPTQKVPAGVQEPPPCPPELIEDLEVYMPSRYCQTKTYSQVLVTGPGSQLQGADQAPSWHIPVIQGRRLDQNGRNKETNRITSLLRR